MTIPTNMSQPLPQLPGSIPPPPVFGTSASGPDKPGAPVPSFLNPATATPSKANLGRKQLVGQ